MTKNLSNSLSNKEQYWFDGDVFLSSVIRENIGIFSSNFDLYNTPTLNLLPDCRHYARQNFMNTQSLETISNWCLNNDSTVVLDSNEIGLFFCEEVEQLFVTHFLSRFQKYITGKNLEEIMSILTQECLALNGASFKKIALKKWSV